MSHRNVPGAADIGDRHRHLLAFALLSIGVGYGASALIHLPGATAEAYLDLIHVGGIVLAVALLVPIFAWKLRNRSTEMRHLYFSPEGFVAETVRRAQKASWEATFVLVLLLASLDNTVATLGLPPEFFLKAVVTTMAGVFAVAFLVLNRVERTHEADEIEDASGA